MTRARGFAWSSPSRSLALLAVASLACADDGGADASTSDASTETGETGDGDGDPSGDGDGDPATGDGDGDGDPGPDRAALIAELEAPGPYAVGFKPLELSYTPPGADEPRLVPLVAWYPAEPSGDEPLASYSLAGLVQLPNSSTAAEPPIAAGSFPVVVYSHGSGGDGILAYPFAERFASHGWILVAPDHPGNTVSDLLNGNTDPYVELIVNRPADVSAILDELDGGFDGDALASAAELDQVFVFGHSFGGYTSFAAGGVSLDYGSLLASCAGPECLYLEDPEVMAALTGGGDPRIDAISPQAPALYSQFETEAYAALDIPTLLQSGKLDITTTDAEEASPAWAALDNPADVWLDMPFGGHYSFITICDDLTPELLALVQPDNQDDGCGPDFTPTSEIIPVLATYMLGFARQHVLGEEQFAVIFDGEPLHPELDVLRH